MTDTPMPPGEPGGDAAAYPPAGPAAAPAAARGSRRGLAIGGAAAALAVVAGAAVWATTTLSGGGRQPDELVPRTTFAYAKIDLDPAANQKLAAREFFGRFPRLKDDTGNEETIFEDVLADVAASEDLDFDRDVKPWFDKRAAVAAFPGADGKPAVVVVLRSKDDDKARASLERADGAYRLVKGYAVVGEDQATVDEAVRLAEKESLRDNETYREDVDRLDGDQVAVAWANVGQSYDAVTGSFPIPIPLPPGVDDQVKGRVVAGVRLTGDYVEVQGRLFGMDQRATPAPSDQHLIRGLPANTVAAMSFSGLGKTINDAAGADLDTIVGGYLQGTGLTAADITSVLGGEAVVASDKIGGLGTLRAGLVAEPADRARAAASAERVNAIAGALGLPVAARVEGDLFTLATPGEYGAALAKGGGGLGATPRFTKAVGDLKGAGSVAYVDLKALQAAFPSFFGEDLKPLTSFGMVSGSEGGAGFFRIRVVAG